MAVKIIGLDGLQDALNEMLKRFDDLEEFVHRPLAEGMRKHAHVDTGRMRSSVYSKHDHSGADAPYAGYEADRGGSHDFGQAAIDDFDARKFLEHIVEPF